MEVGQEIRAANDDRFSDPSYHGGGVRWDTADFIAAHYEVRSSGKCNFEGCKIPIPTSIRYDRMREALGNHASPHEQKVLSLLEYGMPIDCKAGYGSKKQQKNHHSAVNFKDDIEQYLVPGHLGSFPTSPYSRYVLQSSDVSP